MSRVVSAEGALKWIICKSDSNISRNSTKMDIKRKIYISLPITSRKEQTIEERVQAAFKRCELLKRRIAKVNAFKGWEIVTPFDVAPIGTTKTEAEILGGCVQAVLECDAILLDRDYTESKGARLESEAAAIYGKQMYVVAANTFKIIDLSNHYKPIE